MSFEYLKINGEELVPVANIRKISAITPKDRESLASLGDHVDAERFGSRIDYTDKSKGYVPETVEDFAGQGASLVEVDNGRFVLAGNIKTAKDLTDADRKSFESRTGRAMRADYMSRIEMKSRGGPVLATVRADMVMKRIAQPYRPGAQTAVAENAENPVAETDGESEPAIYESAADSYGLT